MLMEKSGAERLKMACGMFDMAQALVRSNLKSQGFSEEEIPVQLFLRFYGREFDSETTARIVEAISRWHSV